MDVHKNFAYSTVATAPSPAASGTSLVVAAGEGANFPTVPFNAVIWPVGVQPTIANAEIVRVTARSTDTLTITRTQESTSARTVIVGDQIAAAITAKTLTDAETAARTLVGDLLFTDATYDIGKSGATRPRDGFFSRNGAFGGTLGVTGVLSALAGLRPGTGSTSLVKSVEATALSASDVDLATGGSCIFFWITDVSVGGYCYGVYLNTTSITILGQAGAATWTTAAPAAGEIQLKDGGAKLTIRAGSTRNNDSIRAVYFVL